MLKTICNVNEVPIENAEKWGYIQLNIAINKTCIAAEYEQTQTHRAKKWAGIKCF